MPMGDVNDWLNSTACTQEDAVAAAAQWLTVADQLRSKVPRLATPIGVDLRLAAAPSPYLSGYRSLAQRPRVTLLIAMHEHVCAARLKQTDTPLSRIESLKVIVLLFVAGGTVIDLLKWVLEIFCGRSRWLDGRFEK